MYEPSKIFTAPEPQVVTEPWRKALLDAAEYIRVHGHCKGKFDNARGEVCAWGALIKVTGEDDWTAPLRALEAHVGNVPEWNDQFSRTKEDVIHALQKCARS